MDNDKERQLRHVDELLKAGAINETAAQHIRAQILRDGSDTAAATTPVHAPNGPSTPPKHRNATGNAPAPQNARRTAHRASQQHTTIIIPDNSQRRLTIAAIVMAVVLVVVSIAVAARVFYEDKLSTQADAADAAFEPADMQYLATNDVWDPGQLKSRRWKQFFYYIKDRNMDKLVDGMLMPGNPLWRDVVFTYLEHPDMKQAITDAIGLCVQFDTMDLNKLQAKLTEMFNREVAPETVNVNELDSDYNDEEDYDYSTRHRGEYTPDFEAIDNETEGTDAVDDNGDDAAPTTTDTKPTDQATNASKDRKANTDEHWNKPSDVPNIPQAKRQERKDKQHDNRDYIPARNKQTQQAQQP
ncbi:MAG: hypothetical protein MJZ74_00105 [Muribaculaceae bacterium]|nr:hypothetical protein [Muribaculaceae bacterium]